MKQMHFINLKFTTLPLTRPRAARDRQRDGGPRGTPAPGAPTSFTPQTHSPTTTKAHPPTHPYPPVRALGSRGLTGPSAGPDRQPPLHQPPTAFTPRFSRVFPPIPLPRFQSKSSAQMLQLVRIFRQAQYTEIM